MINFDESKYSSLHTHSVYSCYDGMSTIEELVEQAVAHGHKSMALTDHGNISGAFNFQKTCLKSGIKPLLGMEGYVVDNLVTNGEKGKRIRTPNGHVILIAKNEKGWKNLLKLNYLSNSDEDHYYYKPRFSFEEMLENHEGLICSTACLASPLARLLLDGKEKEAEEKLLKYLDSFKDDLYAEIQLNEIANQKIYDDWLIDQANKHGIPIIITGDVHYAKPEGAIVQKLAFSIRGDGDGQDFAAKYLYYHGISDYLDFNKKFNYNYPEEKIVEWCENTSLISDKVNYLIPERTKMRLPRQAFDEYGALEKKAKEGLAKHFNCDYKECPKEYIERLDYELKLMWKKGIARYILCLADIINWCDGEGQVAHGIGRGCFLPDNLVTMADGSQKKISEVKIGEEVITGFGKKRSVGDVKIYDVNEEMIELIMPIKNSNITCTKDHKILVANIDLNNVDNFDIKDAVWKEAEKIDVKKDLLIDVDSETGGCSFCKVTDKKHFWYNKKVYDLSIVGDDHSYKINNFAVHNSACGSLVLACVGITGWAIDPIKYNLLFERFVSEERLPDVIIDYSKSGNGGK